MIRYNIYKVKDVTRYLILLGIPFIKYGWKYNAFYL